MEQDLLRKIGKRIKIARKRKGLTQEELSGLISAGAPHISNIENGKKIFSIELLVELCNALEVSPNELLGDCINTITPEMANEYIDIIGDMNQEQLRVALSLTKAYLEETTSKYKTGDEL